MKGGDRVKFEVAKLMEIHKDMDQQLRLNELRVKELGRLEKFKHLRPAPESNSASSSMHSKKNYTRRSMDSRINRRSAASSDYGPKKKAKDVENVIPRSSRMDKRKPQLNSNQSLPDIRRNSNREQKPPEAPSNKAKKNPTS